MNDLEKIFKEKKREEARKAKYSLLTEKMQQRFKERNQKKKRGTSLSPNPLLPKRNTSCRDLLLKKAKEDKVEPEIDPVQALSRRISE